MSKETVLARDFDGTQTGAHNPSLNISSLLSGDIKPNVKTNHTHNILFALGIPSIIEKTGPMVWDMSHANCQVLAAAWADKCNSTGVSTKLGFTKPASYDQITQAILDLHLCNSNKDYHIKFRDGESEQTKNDLKAEMKLMDVTFTNFPLITDALRTRPVKEGGLGLTSDEAFKIPLIVGFPKDNMTVAGKNEHIALGINALTERNILRKDVTPQVTLRDDDGRNIIAAKNMGYTTFWVDHDKPPKSARPNTPDSARGNSPIPADIDPIAYLKKVINDGKVNINTDAVIDNVLSYSIGKDLPRDALDKIHARLTSEGIRAKLVSTNRGDRVVIPHTNLHERSH